MFSKQSQSGQTLIIILVIMVVSLTVGLAVASRSITDVRLSTQAEQSQRAFSAAEAGIEDALRQDLQAIVTAGGGSEGSFSSDVGGVPYTVTVTKAAESDTFATDRMVVKDDVAQISTKDADIDTLEIYWVDTSSDTEKTIPQASLEVSEIYKDSTGKWQMKKYAYNPPATVMLNSETNNGFTPVVDCGGSCTISGKTFKYKTQINLAAAGTEIFRIKPVYNGATVAVKILDCGSGGDSCVLPAQSYTVESSSTIAGVTRKIQITKSLKTLPPIFDFVLFSGSGPISK